MHPLWQAGLSCPRTLLPCSGASPLTLAAAEGAQDGITISAPAAQKPLPHHTRCCSTTLAAAPLPRLQAEADEADIRKAQDFLEDCKQKVGQGAYNWQVVACL